MAGITRKVVLDEFAKLAAIPRQSGNEAAVAQYIASWGKEHGYESMVDEANNVIVTAPATPGLENKPGVIIQGHIDMVCEKTPESTHDFTKDPIIPIEKDGHLVADGTSLGADDGIAIAIGMAVATQIPHPKLEIFGTASEEIGLVGVQAFKPGILKGSLLLNIDSEEEGYFFVGCAGGIYGEMKVPISYTTPNGNKLMSVHVVVGGMSGGHSGSEIYKCKGNAIIAMQRFFTALHETGKEFWLEDVSGGNADNAIPRDAGFVVVFDESAHKTIHNAIIQTANDLKEEMREVEPDLRFDVHHHEDYKAHPALSSRSGELLSNFIAAFPCGIFQRDMNRGGLVQASANLASVVLKGDWAIIRTYIRGNYNSLVDAAVDRLQSFCDMAGVELRVFNGYPAWQPNYDSPLVAKAKKVYSKLFSADPEVLVIHAGLECGMLASKYPSLDMISYGPDLFEPHTPKEAMSLESLDHIVEFTEELIKAI